MFSLITDMDAIRLLEIGSIRIEASDRAALMMKWLSELNYRHVTEYRLFGKFEIVEISDKWLEGEVRGERIDPTRHTIFTEIKAVTFHGVWLELRRTSLEGANYFRPVNVGVHSKPAVTPS